MKQKQDTFTLGVYTLTVLLFLVIVGVFSIYQFRKNQPDPELWPPVITVHQSSIPPLWMRDNIFIDPDEHQMITANGKLIFIGNEDATRPSCLIALDTISGTAEWNKYCGPSKINLATSSSSVFVGEVGYVIAVNADTGERIWSTYLPFTRSVTKTLVINKTLYVDTVSKNLFLLDTETGNILNTISYEFDDVPIWSDKKMDLEIVGNDMYFDKLPRLPGGEGKVSSIDKLSGTERWSVNVSMSSRANASSLGIFLLASDGWLLQLDPITGAKKQVVQFAPAPLKWSATRQYGYHVAVDAENRLLIVYLGDSAQLFAFRLP
ncbi:MAG: PQQ-binding-like beta-propeller repeat protein [Anaerolineales bacterium]